MDDTNILHVVAPILDLMLNLADPKNQLLVQYLASIDSANPTGVIPQKASHKGVEGT